jgi:cytochrome P450
MDIETSPTDATDEQRLQHIAYRRSAEPVAYFSELRARGPLAVNETYEAATVEVLNRADIETVLRAPALFSSAMGIMGSVDPVIPVGIDPPYHSEYRRLLDPAFSPRRMQELEPSVVEHANQLIDSFIHRGECDFSAELSVPLPCVTFLDLLGIPQEELPKLFYWKEVMTHGTKLAGSFEGGRKLAEDTAPEIYLYLNQVIADRRETPSDDLITRLLDARIENGRALTDNEISRCLYQLIAAGLDTVSMSLQCIFHYLATHPEARDMLVDNPEGTNSLIEELLRWETPVQMTAPRIATQDTEVSGCPIKAGTVLSPVLAAGNIDPAVPGADTINLERGDKRHIAFGAGPHRCLGSHLARMELRVVVREWHKRIPKYRLKEGDTVEWNSATLRGVEHLRLEWDTKEAKPL